MIHYPSDLQAATLCTLQFVEPIETELYPEQYDYYAPKITNQELKVQVLISAALYAFTGENVLWIRAYTESGMVKLQKAMTVATVSSGIYTATATFSKSDIAAISENTCAYFSIEKKDKSVVYATSLYYIINPTDTKDLKQITYGHSENDYNVQFGNDTFQITLECGFKPSDLRTEQEQEDFMQQNMVNETVYGDSYEVKGLTTGVIPFWLAHKLDMASILDTFKINDVAHTRIQGSKMEKTESSQEGLGVYKLDLQTLINYLQ